MWRDKVAMVVEDDEAIRAMLAQAFDVEVGAFTVVAPETTSTSGSCPSLRPRSRHRRSTGGPLEPVARWMAAAAGLEPAMHAGHVPRAGLASSAAAAGVPERAVA